MAQPNDLRELIAYFQTHLIPLLTSVHGDEGNSIREAKTQGRALCASLHGVLDSEIRHRQRVIAELHKTKSVITVIEEALRDHPER